MLSIVYSPLLEIVGALTTTAVVLWAVNELWNEWARSIERRRRRERRRIERALVARTRCGVCGSRTVIVEPPAETDGQKAAGAIADYLRARIGSSAR